MKKSLTTSDPGCVAAATSILGDKWTPLILRALAANKCLRFSQLQTITGVNPRTLSARLVHLEGCGILNKTSYSEVPPRCEYTLTKKGEDLIPILESMAHWGVKYAHS